jgi:uncharacterized membrane protein YccF (DUF307 family)
MSLLLNIIWILLGGAWMAFGWLDRGGDHGDHHRGASLGQGAVNIALYTLMPFGYTAVPRDRLTGQEDIGTGVLGGLGNIIWLVFAGWWLALAHVITAVMLAVTIIGIPFAWAHLKLAGIALWPIGKTIVPKDQTMPAHRV